MKDVEEHHIAQKDNNKTYDGLSPFERRMEQINRVKENTSTSYFDKDGLKKQMNSWDYPLHMIDFETSSVALPFLKE